MKNTTAVMALVALTALIECFCGSAQAALLTVPSDTTWKALGPVGNLTGQPFTTAGQSWENANPGWNSSVAFNDSAWTAAIKVHPSAGTLIIWPDGDGHSGSSPAYFRKTFNIPGIPTTGMLSGGEDDDAQVFINGTLVYSDINGLATNVNGLDVTSVLHQGANLIAAKAHNAQGDEGFFATLDVGFNSVPEPSSLALSATGLIVFMLIRASRRSRRAVRST